MMFDESVRKYDGTRPFSRAAQYVHDPHYSDQSGIYGGQKVAACTEYSGAYAGMIIGQRSLRKFLPEEDANRWPPVTKDELDTILPADVLTGWDRTRKGPFVCHTALTGRLAGWIGDLMLILPQSILFGIPRTMEEAFETTQMCGGYTNAYTIETYRSRWPHPSLYASWDYAPIWPMSVIWGPADYYGVLQPSAYLYKRAQEPLHVLMQMDPEELMKNPQGFDVYPKVFQPGGQFKGRVYVVSDLDGPVGELTAEVNILDSRFESLHEVNMNLADMESGPATAFLGEVVWDIPVSIPNQTALVCVSLKDDAGTLLSRSVYPIWISSERAELVREWGPRRDHGPWLTELKKTRTKLRLTPISRQASFSGESDVKPLVDGNGQVTPHPRFARPLPQGERHSEFPLPWRERDRVRGKSLNEDYLPSGKNRCASVVLEVENIGEKPAFHTGMEIANADCRYLFDDNYFTLMPGETKQVTATIDRSIEPFYDYVREELIEPVGGELVFEARAWNAPAETATVAVRRLALPAHSRF